MTRPFHLMHRITFHATLASTGQNCNILNNRRGGKKVSSSTDHSLLSICFEKLYIELELLLVAVSAKTLEIM
jgi:hypothetical protein